MKFYQKNIKSEKKNDLKKIYFYIGLFFSYQEEYNRIK